MVRSEANKRHNSASLARYRRIILFLIGFSLLILIAANLFYRLDAGCIADSDEAWHANNAYEMFQSGNWIVNTYQYQTDYYNSKPPLALQMILLAFHWFGVSLMSLKLPSALCGLLIAIIGTVYLWKMENGMSAILFLALYLMLDDLYVFHCFRTGNMDALFCLLSVVSMLVTFIIIGNSAVSHRKAWYCLFGLSIGLAFLTKGPHAAVPLLCGAVCIAVFGRRRNSFSTIGISVLSCAVPIAVWSVQRFSYDGTAFFRAMIFGEVASKTAHPVTAEYFMRLAAVPAFWIWAGITAAYLITAFIRKEVIRNDILVSIIYTVLPVLLYSISGTYENWYIYPSYITGAVGAVMMFHELLTLAQADRILGKLLYLAGVMACVVGMGIGVQRVSGYSYDSGGNPIKDFCEDLKAVEQSEDGNRYNGATAYIQDVFENEDGERDWWKPDELAVARYIAGYDCRDGGIRAFLTNSNDKTTVLILNKDLWDEYSGTLAGRVILQDNSKLIFSNQYY